MNYLSKLFFFLILECQHLAKIFPRLIITILPLFSEPNLIPKMLHIYPGVSTTVQLFTFLSH